MKEIVTVVSSVFSGAVAIVGVGVILHFIGKRVLSTLGDEEDDAGLNIYFGALTIALVAVIGGLLYMFGRFVILPVFGLA